MKRTILWAAIAILTGAVSAQNAAAQVVADSACPLHAVDIAAFATCESDRVTTEELVAEAEGAGPDRADPMRHGTQPAAESAPEPWSADDRSAGARPRRAIAAPDRPES